MTFIEKKSSNIWVILLLTLFWGIVPSYVYAADKCIDCHKDDTFVIQNKKLFDYFRYWKKSTHDIAGITCTDCHGGNSNKTDKEDAHKGNFSSFPAEDKESNIIILDRCGKCHKVALRNFVDSKHYKALSEKDVGPNCITCHGSMNTGILDASNIAKGCGVCHNEETKNKPEMGNVAERVLHKINILRVYMEWVSSHDIFNTKLQKKMVAEYKDIIFSWHTFSFDQIEERLKKPLEKARLLTRGKVVASKKKK